MHYRHAAAVPSTIYTFHACTFLSVDRGGRLGTKIVGISLTVKDTNALASLTVLVFQTRVGLPKTFLPVVEMIPSKVKLLSY